MAFFKGQEIYSIDAKGRVNIPSKMRKSLSPLAMDTFAITRGQDECIVAYPLDEWIKYEERFQDLNQFDSKKRFFLRSMLSWTEESVMDTQQRVTISKRLMDYAGLTHKVLIIGVGDHIEFWDPEKYDTYIEGYNESYEEIAEQVMTLRDER